MGPTCHLGTQSCFKQSPKNSLGFLNQLQNTIEERFLTKDSKESYVSSLAKAGIDKIAQKVGEEAVETVIAAKNSDPEDFKNEAADLLFHLLVLLKAKDSNLAEIVDVLKARSAR